MNTQIYLSGRFTVGAAIEKAWLKRTGCKHRCFSFAFVCPVKIPGMAFNKKVAAALKHCEDSKVKIMMDSGAHSLHTIDRASAKRNVNAKKKQTMDITQLQKLMFDEYVKFCHAGKKKWAFYVTLDFKKEQSVIYQMQKDFAVQELAPTPVYHGDSNIDWLKKHLDMGHKFICIGGATLHPGKSGLAYYFDKVFNFGAKHGISYHGLAFTSLDIIMTWPFKSVDSSTWSRCAAFGMIVIPDIARRKFFNVHVSTRGSSNQNSMNHMTRSQKGELKELLATHDFDLKAMRSSEIERHDWNGFVMSNLAKFGVTQNSKRTWDNIL